MDSVTGLCPETICEVPMNGIVKDNIFSLLLRCNNYKQNF